MRERLITYAEAVQQVHANIAAVAETPALATVGLERLATLQPSPSDMDDEELLLALLELETCVQQMHFAFGSEACREDVERWVDQLVERLADKFPAGTYEAVNDAVDAAQVAVAKRA